MLIKGLRSLSILLLLPGAALASEWVYVVAPGDNLWQLSEKYLGGTERVEALRRLNGVAEPKKMPVGIKLRVPMDWIPPSQPVPATVLEVSGSVRVVHPGGGNERVAKEAQIALGDTLTTDAKSSAAIQFADGSVMTLHGNSEVRFDQLSAYGETGMVDSRAKVLAGRAEARVEKAQGPGSRFEIATPSAISAVRGTEYRAAVTDGSKANIEVLEGSVSVSAQAQEVMVPSGFGTQVAPGEPPMAARALLEAPVWRGVPQQLTDNNLLVRWSAVPQANAYRLETSRRSDFAILEQQLNTSRSEATIADLDDGTHYLRVVAIDNVGLAGFPANTEAEFVATPPPAPKPKVEKGVVNPPSPKVGEHYAGNHKVVWTASTGYRYQVQVAPSTRFSTPTINTVTDTPFLLVPRDADEGRYVRVRVMDGDSPAATWSEPVHIPPALPMPYWPLILTPLLLLLAL